MESLVSDDLTYEQISNAIEMHLASRPKLDDFPSYVEYEKDEDVWYKRREDLYRLSVEKIYIAYLKSIGIAKTR